MPICGSRGHTGVGFLDLYDFPTLCILLKRKTAFFLYGTYGFAQYCDNVSLIFVQDCLRKYIMLTSWKQGW